MKLREFTVYSREQHRGFSTVSADYGAGTHRWKHRVYAASIDHALYLAKHGRFAPNSWLAGVRSVTLSWWWYRSRPEPGDVMQAPYLIKQSQ
jgi:hypothetical protein